MSEHLRLARAHFPVTSLGYGHRLVLWVQGCPLACPGCIAKDTWDPEGGVPVDVADLLGDVRRAVLAGADGLTVSGGEPLRQAAAVGSLLRGVRELDAAFDVLLYTGFELDELDPAQRETAELADVLITGRYVATAPTGLIWRGSANQRMHLRTPLARDRYTEFVEYEPEHPPIQIEADREGRLWWAGVPNRPETKRALDRGLAALGYSVESASWRHQ